MSELITNNAVALQALFSETIFTTGFENTTSIEIEMANTVTVEFDFSDEEFVYRGNKSTGNLFVLRYSDFPYFSPEAEDAFVKTIAALGLSYDNVALVNLANPQNPNDFKRIMEFFSPRKITLLGVEPKSLVLPEIAHNSFMKGRIATVFNTFSFEEMFADVTKKRMFWGEFKIFINGE